MLPIDLIAAVSRTVRESGGSPTKTKVLKLLYLLDIEHFRRTQETLTSFDWLFYRFGPWSAAYDDALVAAQQAGKISLNSPNADEGATFVNAANAAPLSDVLTDLVERLTAESIINTWAARANVELLDYVYFHTSPMRNAKRNERLDFTSVLGEELPIRYKTPRSGASEGEVLSKRRRFEELLNAKRSDTIAPLNPSPRYDEEYWSAVKKIEADDE